MDTIVNAKAMFKASKEEKAKFSSSTCSVTVSLGQKSQIGDKLGATIKIINDNFKECTIMVCDSLHRHNLKIHSKQGNDVLHNLANDLGNSWIEENRRYFSIFKIPYRIIRWDHWLSHINYHNKQKIVDEMYEKNDEYRNSFHESALKFIERDKRKNDYIHFNHEFTYLQSIKYLKEECAVMLLWADEGYNFEIYPSKRIDAMVATHQFLIKPVYQNVLKPVSLELRTLKSRDMANMSELESA
ncbi:MAG: hypothetical protein JSS53_09375 [Proteobacteria bacterium]|nr:hypothetical protein [Pseudomonadota bacterium]